MAPFSKYIAVSSLAWLTVFPVHAQELRQVAVQNLGSSIAYLAICESKNFSEKENYLASKILLSASKTLSSEGYSKLRAQYQTSLHEKLHYSISKNRWFPFRIDKKHCSEIENAAPMLLQHLSAIREMQ